MSNSQNSQMNKGFLSHLMAHLLEGSQIPKVQVERSVGPVLGFFLAEVLTATLKDDEALSGRYRMLCPEFPLAKGNSLQSTNIDFLLYNEDRQALVFLELKTAGSSFSPDQAVSYLENKLKVLDHGAAYLVSDLERIKTASSEPQKYAAVQQMLETRFPGGRGAMEQCRQLHVIYLVPAQLKERDPHLKRMDKALSFGELAMDIDGPFAEEWATIGKALQQLDGNVTPYLSSAVPDGGHLNYQDRVDFEAIKALCSERGAQIVVGFAGGEATLRQSDLKQLRQRVFKWDVAEGGQGNKQGVNWVAGNRFIDIVLSLEAACTGSNGFSSAPARIAAQISKEDLEVGAWYSGKGRNGDVGLWDGEDFLVLGLEGKKVGPDRSDWENEYRIKREPYWTVDEGCFQPFTKLAPAHHMA